MSYEDEVKDFHNLSREPISIEETSNEGYRDTYRANRHLGGNMRGRFFGAGRMYGLLSNNENVHSQSPLIDQLSAEDADLLYKNARGMLTSDLKLKEGHYFFFATGVPSGYREGDVLYVGSAIQNTIVDVKYQFFMEFSQGSDGCFVVGEFSLTEDTVVIPYYTSFLIFEAFPEPDHISLMDTSIYREDDENVNDMESFYHYVKLKNGEDLFRPAGLTRNSLPTSPSGTFLQGRGLNFDNGVYMIFNSYVRGDHNGTNTTTGWAANASMSVVNKTQYSRDGIAIAGDLKGPTAGEFDTDFSLLYARRLLDHPYSLPVNTNEFENLPYHRIKRPLEYHPFAFISMSYSLGQKDDDGFIRERIRTGGAFSDRWRDNIIFARYGRDEYTEEPMLFYIRAFKWVYRLSEEETAKPLSFRITLEFEDSDFTITEKLSDARPWAVFPTQGQKLLDVVIKPAESFPNNYFDISGMALQIVGFN